VSDEISAEAIGEALRAPVLRLEFSEYLTLSDGVWHPGVVITTKEPGPGSKWTKPFKQSVMGPPTRDGLMRALADMLQGVVAYAGRPDPLDEEEYALWLEWVRSEPCFICQDKDNHFGVPHGLATGDGKTRKDVTR
jgi:hypothetical protein